MFELIVLVCARLCTLSRVGARSCAFVRVGARLCAFVSGYNRSVKEKVRVASLIAHISQQFCFTFPYDFNGAE